MQTTQVFGISENSWQGRVWILTSFVTGKRQKPGHPQCLRLKQRCHCTNQCPQSNPINRLTKNLTEEYYFACLSFHSGWWWWRKMGRRGWFLIVREPLHNLEQNIWWIQKGLNWIFKAILLVPSMAEKLKETSALISASDLKEFQ